jgi:HD superfamily phosphohydrolase
MVWPSAENTRLSHSIETEYWAVRLLEALRRNAFASAATDGEQPVGNLQRLAYMEESLGGEFSLELIARLFALVHDIALLPLGHTLQYQFGFFRNAGAECRRVASCLDLLQQELEFAPQLATIYRARFEVAQRVFYNDIKCAADAMLDGALRCIDRGSGQVAGGKEAFSEERLLQMGDDQLLELVENEEARTRAEASFISNDSRSRPLMSELRARRLFEEVFRIDRLSDVREGARRLVNDSLQPNMRDDIETRIMEQVDGLQPGDFVFSCRPLAMQSKPPQMLVGWKSGHPVPFGSIAEQEGYSREVLAVHQQYTDLWCLSVFVSPWARDRMDLVRQACVQIFRGDSLEH